MTAWDQKLKIKLTESGTSAKPEKVAESLEHFLTSYDDIDSCIV